MLDFNVSPYYDDFDHKKHFHRILFRPGRNIQARELTQMQSMMQDQVSKFANHMFNQNTPISGGKVSINTNSTSLTLAYEHDFVDDGGNETLNIDAFMNSVVVNSDPTSPVRAKVIAITEPEFDDEGKVSSNPRVILRYTTGAKFKLKDILYIPDTAIRGYITSVDTVTTASITDGVYYIINGHSYSDIPNPDGTYEKYVLGHFVSVDAQNIVASNESSASVKIGLSISESIIDYIDDATLLDSALGTSNYQAPGADRYVIRLALESRPLDGSSDDFIELVRLQNGIIVKQFDNTSYKELDDYIAKRTRETNGDFIVDNFKISIDNWNPADDNFQLKFGPGIAYVQGYRVENKSTVIDVPKARSVSTKKGSLNINYGSYFVLSSIESFPDLTNFPTMDLKIDADEKLIGTARVRSLYRTDGSSYNICVFDVDFYTISGKINPVSGGATVAGNYELTYPDDTKSYGSVDLSGCTIIVKNVSYTLQKTLSTGNPVYTLHDINGTGITSIPTNSAYTITFNGNNVKYIKSTDNFIGTISVLNKGLKNAGTSTALFYPLSNVIGKSFSGISYSSFIKHTLPASSGSIIINSISLSLSPSSSPINYSDKFNYFIILNSSNADITDVVSITYQNNTINITSSTTTPLDGTYTVYIKTNNTDISPNIKKYIQYTGTISNTKSVSSETSPKFTFYEDNGIVIIKPENNKGKIYLGVADVVKIRKIFYMEDTSPTINNLKDKQDCSSDYTFNNGQTDNYYDYAWIKLKPNKIPSTLSYIVVCFDYFKPDVSSSGYFSPNSYNNVSDKSVIPTYTMKNGSTINLMNCLDFRPVKKPLSTSTEYYENITFPVNGDEISYDSYEYYTSRKDLIVLNSDKTFGVVQGGSSTNPIYPKQPHDSLLLGKMTVDAYTFKSSDVYIEPIYHKRWTMEDISNLNTRITNLEYYTSLSLLEQSTKNLQIKDKYGNNRFQNGFFVDDFSNFKSADFTNSDFSSAINTRNNRLTAIQDVKKIVLANTTVGLSNTVNNLTKIYHLPISTQENILTTSAKTTTSSTLIIPIVVSPVEGILEVSPAMDNWIDYNIEPSVTNIDPSLVGFNLSDDVNSLHLSDWKSIIGVELSPASLTEITKSDSKNKYGTTSIFGNFIKYDNIQPYIRPQQLLLKLKGSTTSTPSTSLSIMFDGVDVSNYVYSLNKLNSSPLDPSLYKSVEGNYCIYSGYTHTCTKDTSAKDTSAWNTKSISDSFESYTTGRISGISSSSANPTKNFRRWIKLEDSTNNIFVNKHAVWYNETSGNDTVFSITINKLDSVKKYTLKYYLNGIDTTTSSIKNLDSSKVVSSLILNDITTVNNITSTSSITVTLNANSTPNVIPFAAIEITDSEGNVVYSTSKCTGFYTDTAEQFIGGGYYLHQNEIILDENNNNTAKPGSIIAITSTNISSDGIKTTSINFAKIKTVDNNNNITLDSSVPISMGYNNKFGDITSTYSIISNTTDDTGMFLGVLNIPANMFKTGEKSIKIKSNNKVLADTTFYASPLIKKATWNTYSPSVSGAFDSFTEIKYKNKTDIYDPLAQTFEIPELSYPSGVYLSYVNLFVIKGANATIDGNAYISIKIVETTSGIPNGNIIDYSLKTLGNDSIKTDDTAATSFYFDAPVYLRPGIYALIVQSNESDYKLQTISYVKDVKNNPLIGKLFLPQNAADWVGETTQSLKFEVYVHKFTTPSKNIIFNVNKNLPNKKVLEDELLPMELISAHSDSINNEDFEYHSMNVTSTDYIPPNCSLSYSCETLDTDIKVVPAINVITGKYGTPKENDIYKNDSVIRKLYANNTNSFVLTAELSSSDKYVSPMISDEGLGAFVSQYKINNLGLKSSQFTVKDTISTSTSNEIKILRGSSLETGNQATASAIIDNNTLKGINITYEGSGYINPPIIKLNDKDITANVSITSELSSSGGNADCKYITKSIILSENNDSKDLKVYCNAYRPIGTDIIVFCKLRSKDDSTPISNNNWNLMHMTGVNTSAYAKNRDDIYEYEFSIGQTGTEILNYTNALGNNYYEFIEYVIKVILVTNNKNYVPYLTNLRAIALPSYE